MSTVLNKILSTADIVGGDVFFATSEGKDPENINSPELLPDGMYIRLEGSDGSKAYVSAFELDKSIDIIAKLSEDKANDVDVKALQQLLESKASDIEVELIKNSLDSKADNSDIDAINAALELKANTSDIDAINTALDSKADNSDIDAINTALELKANKEELDEVNSALGSKTDLIETDIEQIKSDIESLQTTLETLTNTSSIAAIQNQITYLNNELNKKIEASTLTPITNSIEDINASIETINDEILNIKETSVGNASKVYVQTQVKELNDRITANEVALQNTALKEDVVLKANQEDFIRLNETVTELSNAVNNKIPTIESNYEELTRTVSNKANAASLEEAKTRITSIETTIENSNLSSINTELIDLDRRLDIVEEDKSKGYNTEKLSNDIYELECSVNNALSSINATVSNQTKQLTAHTTQITDLQKKDNTFDEQLKNEWVKVMTTDQFENLKRRKLVKSNTVYMLVNYNKPQAVYIGEILIAQAEKKGSVGFAYIFPISF